MKKLLTGFLLTLSLANPTFVGAHPTQTTKDSWNPITIYNNTGKHIAYAMMGSYGGAVYGIEKDMTDVYHSGIGDQYATFQVAICKNNTSRDPHGCNDLEPLKPCSNGYYNANLIKSIVVNSLTSCIITCLDGGLTSCKQS